MHQSQQKHGADKFENLNNFLRKYALLILLILGFATRFLWIWYPPNVVWDEQHFSNFTKGYLTGEYFFDIHPPLGKLILAAGLKLREADPSNIDFAIGNPYPENYPYVAARALPALAGSLLPALIYIFARALALSPIASFFAAAFVLFDNAILTESRFALIDIFVPLFGFAALFCFAMHRKKERYSRGWWLWFCGAAFAAALALGTKWTGGGMLLAIGFAMFVESVGERSLKLFFTRFALACVVVGVVYTGLFAAHFALLPKSGPGDAFMSERFRVSLRGAAEQEKNELAPKTFLEKTMELNGRMFEVNANQELTHQDSSQFYEWPIGRKRIYFWVDKEDGLKRIYLLANPVVWFFGTITAVGSILYLFFRRRALRELAQKDAAWNTRIRSLEFLYAVYLVNFLPFAAISRAMFLYHYFSSLIASILIGSLLLFHIVPALESSVSGAEDGKNRAPGENRYAFWILLMLAFVLFIALAPYSYGFRPFLGS